MTHTIHQYLSDMENLAGALKHHLDLEPTKGSGKVLLQAQGMENSGAWLLVNGLAKQYRFNFEGKMQITGFWRKGDVILLPQSFFSRQKAGDYIELIEDSIIAPFKVKDIYQLEKALPEQRIVSAISNVYIQRADIRLQLIGMVTSQAIKHLAVMYPLSRIRNKDIASFLLKDPSSFYRASR